MVERLPQKNKNIKGDLIMTIEIYSMKMATYLRKLGFRIVSVEVNPYKPHFDMWLFEDTPELRTAMSKFNKNDK